MSDNLRTLMAMASLAAIGGDGNDPAWMRLAIAPVERTPNPVEAKNRFAQAEAKRARKAQIKRGGK